MIGRVFVDEANGITRAADERHVSYTVYACVETGDERHPRVHVAFNERGRAPVVEDVWPCDKTACKQQKTIRGDIPTDGLFRDPEYRVAEHCESDIRAFLKKRGMRTQTPEQRAEEEGRR